MSHPGNRLVRCVILTVSLILVMGVAPIWYLSPFGFLVLYGEYVLSGAADISRVAESKGRVTLIKPSHTRLTHKTVYMI